MKASFLPVKTLTIYRETFKRENFKVFVAIRESFLREIGGHGIFKEQRHQRVIRNSLLISAHSRKFSPSKFSRYTVILRKHLKSRTAVECSNGLLLWLGSPHYLCPPDVIHVVSETKFFRSRVLFLCEWKVMGGAGTQLVGFQSTSI